MNRAHRLGPAGPEDGVIFRQGEELVGALMKVGGVRRNALHESEASDFIGQLQVQLSDQVENGWF